MTTKARPFGELRDSGVLWLINTAVLHPRGFALAIHFAGDCRDGDATGWSIMGDGTEAWTMGVDPTDEEREKYNAKSIDELFAALNETLAAAARANSTEPPDAA